MHFRHKHVETGPNCSHELALKYVYYVIYPHDRKNTLCKKLET